MSGKSGSECWCELILHWPPPADTVVTGAQAVRYYQDLLFQNLSELLIPCWEKWPQNTKEESIENYKINSSVQFIWEKTHWCTSPLAKGAYLQVYQLQEGLLALCHDVPLAEHLCRCHCHWQNICVVVTVIGRTYVHTESDWPAGSWFLMAWNGVRCSLICFFMWCLSTNIVKETWR